LSPPAFLLSTSTSFEKENPADAYANGPLAHENWLAQYEAEDKRNKNLIGLLLQ